LGRRALQHAQENDWGLYRNDKFQMAEFLRSEGKHVDALAIYFEVCYLDFNGPMNNGAATAFVIPKYSQVFAPAVLEVISWIGRIEKMDRAALRAVFLEQTQLICNSLRPPRTPSDCWVQLEAELLS